MNAKEREGIPGVNWWGSLSGVADARDRARGYYKVCSEATPRVRQKMDNALLTLSASKDKYKLIDSKGEFIRELQHLKKTQGTEAYPGIFQDDVDYIGPTLSPDK